MFWWGSPKANDDSEDQGGGERLGSELILERLAGGCGLDSTGGSCCECGDEPSCTIELVIVGQFAYVNI
jgi:hypothetical protein